MEMRKPRWLLLAIALSFAASLGCGSDAVSNPRDSDGDDNTDVTESPSSGDDEGDATQTDGDDADDEGDKPARDAGTSDDDDDDHEDPDAGDQRRDGGARNSDSDAGASSDDDSGAADPDDDGAVDPGPGAGTGGCGPEVMISAAELGDTKKLGPWKPMHVERTGPRSSSWVYYPEGLGKDGIKHPVFQWGPGAGTGPSNYLDHLNLLASHGFVVVSQASTQSGKEALDWLLMQNETEGSMWYQKLDPDRVGRGGHSMGALQSMSEADDDRLKATVLVCGGASGGGGADKIDYPSIFLGGVGESGTRNFAGDYAEVKGLSVFVTHSDTDHIACARDNMGPWVAFMRWHLCGEEEQWKKEFMPGGTYCKSPWEACMTKSL